MQSYEMYDVYLHEGTYGMYCMYDYTQFVN